MTMQIYNSQTRQLQPLQPIEPGVVRIYCCGPTVYNYIHIGNARPFVVFDTLRRFLAAQGYKVIYVQNFTDIDDKMIKRAAEENTTVAELGDRYIDAYFEDTKALNLIPADHHPRATRHIGEMIGLIQKLVKKGMAYVNQGDVYFDTKAFEGYGRLSGQALDDLEAGARIEPGEVKHNPMDFALWKAQKPGEPAWNSPWGMGRPGWHIECSAMSMKYLGETMDIHAGGEDLLFPHHENEVAQSEAATGKPFVNCWMHNAFLQVDHKKMSKSLGNFFTLHDILKDYDGEVIRFYLIAAHYRSPLQFSDLMLQQAQSALQRLYTFRAAVGNKLAAAPEGPASPQAQQAIDAARAGFDAAMNEDLNTADALAAVYELVRTLNPMLHDQQAALTRTDCQQTLDLLAYVGNILGVLQRPDEIDDPAAEALLEQRKQAREAKDYALSDQLRDQLKAMGYVVEDTANGQKLRRA